MFVLYLYLGSPLSSLRLIAGNRCLDAISVIIWEGAIPHSGRAISVAFPPVLGLLGSAALAAHGPGSDVDDDCEEEGDEQKDAHAEGVASDDLGDPVEALLGGRRVEHGLEVPEQTRVADTVAVEGCLKVLQEFRQRGRHCREVGVLAVSRLSLGSKTRHVVVAVPEVGIVGRGVSGVEGEGEASVSRLDREGSLEGNVGELLNRVVAALVQVLSGRVVVACDPGFAVGTIHGHGRAGAGACAHPLGGGLGKRLLDTVNVDNGRRDCDGAGAVVLHALDANG